VEVDEAGRDDEPIGFDGFLREAGGASAELRDLAILDVDVAAIARDAGAIDDGSAFNLEIDSCSLLDR
jgi:hypothetical protein